MSNINDLINTNDEFNKLLNRGNKMELTILSGCIKNRDYIYALRELLKYLWSPHIRQLCQWCVTYYDEHDEAPGTKIQKVLEDESYDTDIKEIFKILIEKALTQYRQTDLNVAQAQIYLVDCYRFKNFN